MTLGEVKKEALKLMFTNQSAEVNARSIEELSTDDNYGDYLSNMNGSINRCFARFKNKGIEFGETYQRLTDDTDDGYELDFIDVELVEIIPYWIKGELYEEDNVAVAMTTKNYFDDLLEEYLNRPQIHTIDKVYEM